MNLQLHNLTYTTPTSIFGGPSRPVESRFNDAFWRQLVFDQFDSPNTIDDPSTRIRVPAKNLNVYIRMGDPTGRRVVSYDQRDHMRRAIPRLAEQLTGEPYTGGLSRSLLIFASGDCGVILCDSLGGRLLLGFEITEG